MTRVIAIIPARAGSKGLPKKNILPLAGVPLIAHTIEAALMAEHVGRVIVSTDGEDIAAAAREAGADVPFMRPQPLATDTATSESVLVHALQWLEENGDSPDIIVYLQPTEPFRSPGMIDSCVECLIRDPAVDSAFMAAIDHKNYWREDAAGSGKFSRLAVDISPGAPRQSKQPLYRENTGVALATRADVIRLGKRIGERVEIVPYEQDFPFIDIHTEMDLKIAETLVSVFGIIPTKG